MNRFSLGYSHKNIPAPIEKEYIMAFLEKTEELFKRMRWKAFYYNNRNETQQNYQTDEKYGLRTKNSPPSIKRIKKRTYFSDYKTLNLRKLVTNFKNKLKSDVRKISTSDEIIVSADKTKKMYKMSYENYDKLLSENITQKY